MPQARIFLIDGTSFCYRAFYAIRNLSTSDGRPTNAVYGFEAMLKSLKKSHNPDYLAVAFDAGKPTFRHAKYEGYKKQRKPMPDALISQLPLIKRLLLAHKVAIFELEGYEADDLLASIVKKIDGPEREIFLVSGDKDMLQLVKKNVKVCNPQKEDIVLDEEKVFERYGVRPDQVVDLMALMGDGSDNIPGVPGIGEKTASMLISEFKSLDSLYERLDELKSQKTRELLKENKKQALLSRELALMDSDVPIEVSLKDLAVNEPDSVLLKGIYKELEFKRLLSELIESFPEEKNSSVCSRVVSDEGSLKPLLKILRVKKPVAVQCHKISDDPEDRGFIISLSASPQEAFVVVLDDINQKWALPVIQWLASESNPKIGHDIKKMIFMLRQADLDLKGIYDDTMLSSYLLNPAFSDPSLPDASEKWLDMHLVQVPDILAKKIESIPYQDIAECACAVYRLSGILQNELKKNHLDELYRDVEMPLLSVLADMESDGISIDCELLSKMKSRMQNQLAEIEGRLYKIAGTSFNLNSPKQLSEVLFTHLKLPVIKKTKTGASTDSEVLQRLSSLHEFPRQLIEYREISKLVSTYVEALPQLVNPKTKRVHTTFHQTKTATGRLSSSDPNLQNIPIRTDLGRQIRKAFIPGKSGWVLLAADYSQIELRILAHLSKDPALIEAFRKEHDIHRYTASLIYGVDEGDVTPEMRNSMKEINYGIIYGMSAFGLSKQLGISNEEAASFIQSYFARYKNVQPFFEEQIKKAKEEGFVRTILGRRRYIPELKSPDPAIRQFGERMAINAPLQGSAADLIKVAMIRLAEKLKKVKISGKMILQVHDELVFESSPNDLKELALLAKDTMENAIEMSVPILVSLKSGPNWLELTKID